MRRSLVLRRRCVVIFATTATGSGSEARRAAARSASAPRSGIDSLNPYVAFNQDAYSTFEYIYPVLVQYDSNLHFAPVLRDVVEALERRQDLDVQDAAARQVERRQAAHGGRRRLDDQHRHQVQERRRRERGRPDRPHQERDGAERDDARRPLRAGARPSNVLGQFQQFFILPKHIWAQHIGQQGRRPEDVPEQRAGRRLRPVQARQVPEEPDRDLPAQQLLLGHEAEDRRVRAAAVLERRRDGHGAEGARARRDRGRARDGDQDAAPGGLHRLGRAGARPDRLHHQLEPEEEEATASSST